MRALFAHFASFVASVSGFFTVASIQKASLVGRYPTAYAQLLPEETYPKFCCVHLPNIATVGQITIFVRSVYEFE
jgi:hypothetical protein